MENSGKQKVFNLGFSKTGTTSVEEGLQLLGYNVCRGHFNNSYTNFLIALYVNKDYKELMKFTYRFDAFADGPWGGGDLYKTLLETHPGAKYILTVRDAEAWYSSFEKMLTRFDPNLATAFDTFYANGRYGTPYFFRHIFGIETMEGAKEKMIAYYNAYNQQVIDYFKSKNKELLVMDLAKGDGWNKLCPFLGHEMMQQPFPHKNKEKSAASKKPAASAKPAPKPGLLRRVVNKLF
jgi:hypothetical protein